ncbi:MAG: PHP domain-containing protein [Kiritimatiellae bacterium]|nr:PHP domain-containing protein [Kiritimatiellia bacterium]
MREIACDWHIHSCLSPCASLDMDPADIARAAAERGLGSIAVTDHNSARNAPAFAAACARHGLRGLYGMEITSAEEIHCLALFDDPAAAMAAGAEIEARLPRFKNIPEELGDQPVVDEEGNILDFVDNYLGSATDLPFSRLPGWVAERGGLFIPAHVDRPAFSVLSALGCLPEEAGPILECTRFGRAAIAERYGAGRVLVTHSDAHQLDQVGTARNVVTLPEGAEWKIEALREALLAGRG